MVGVADFQDWAWVGVEQQVATVAGKEVEWRVMQNQGLVEV